MRGQSQAQDVSGNQPSAMVSSFQRTTLSKKVASVSGTICSQARCSGTACLALFFFFFSGETAGLLLVLRRVEPDLEWTRWQ